MKEIPQGFSFEDVLVDVQDSDIPSRYTQNKKLLNTATKVARGVPEINRPIISANMDTVTEYKMAQTMALHGCLGILHRNMTPEEQAEQVRLVKEKMRVIEEHPPTINQNATIQDALNLLKHRKRGYVIVHSEESFTGNFTGIATTRDFKADAPDTPIRNVMTPNEKNKMFLVKIGTSLEEAVSFMKENRIEKVPVINPDGSLAGVYTLSDHWFREMYPDASLDTKGRLMIGAAIGAKEIDIERAHRLQEAGADVLVIDIAHGQLFYTKEMLERLRHKEGIEAPIIAGNFATKKGVRDAREYGADAVKIGIGPGFVCDTRIIAGVGVPQITAILRAAEALADDPIPIIADGGIRDPGDVGKAVVAGANSVMIGSLLAGTDMSPGRTVVIDGKMVKNVRGMASARAFRHRQQLGDDTNTNEDRQAWEGRDEFTPFKGKTENVIFELADDGLRSTMSYVGAHSIEELRKKGELIRVSQAGANEQKRPLG